MTAQKLPAWLSEGAGGILSRGGALFCKALLLLALGFTSSWGADRTCISGIYPHLATFNDESECGTGAVVPWADRLWVISYGPHLPYGSSDRLYEITPQLDQIVRRESVGGTHANRMLHRESRQLIIGPYFIDAQRRVRVISPRVMPGRLTGAARHLVDPANKVYFATMEEGLYEVNVNTLEVTGLIRDGNKPSPGQTAEARPANMASKLPGYHGKGFFSGQGRLIYANNGEEGRAAQTAPTTPSGALAEWRKPGEDWQLVRRNQFCEVTGPGGISGNAQPETDPVWSTGWDAKSVLLLCLDRGTWHTYRLPKGSHAYDGAHGWNTEWPRIRDIGEQDLLMTMHGLFWAFPKEFNPAQSTGIRPRSAYLKVIGDFCRWNDRVVFGCDDSAKSEFLNKRKAKGNIAAPGRSQSNLWFVEPGRLDGLGPALGHGAVWLQEPVTSSQPSEPFLFSGFEYRGLHLAHDSDSSMQFRVEVDARGDGKFTALREIKVPAKGYVWTGFTEDERGAWVRLVAAENCRQVTAWFEYRNAKPGVQQAATIFSGLASPADVKASGGLLHARGADFKTLRFVARDAAGELGCYDLDGGLTLRRTNDTAGADWVKKNLAVPRGVLQADAASLLYTDEKGRWRLPRGDAALDALGPVGPERVCREVCTERDLFNAGGIFYELPAENAGGFAKIRPIATHNRRISDYASYRGLLVMSGIASGTTGERLIRSDDGRCALWVGAVDDLWQFGKTRGVGGPWSRTKVKANEPSDPYLMTGFDRKRITISHEAAEAVGVRIEVDIAGTGLWMLYKTLEVQPGNTARHDFPEAFAAYWVRTTADRDTTATVTLVYE